MRCSNCNNENAEGTRFCVYCGSPLSGQQPQQPQQPQMQQMPQQPQQPQMQQPQMQQMPQQPQQQVPPTLAVTKKRGQRRFDASFFIAIGIVALIIGAVIFFLTRPTSVDMKDYVKVSYTGCDGHGKASISIDRDKFIKDYENKISFTSEYKDKMKRAWGPLADAAMEEEGPAKEFLSQCVSVTCENTEGLSNGDKLDIKIEINEKNLKYFKVKAEDSEFKYTVKGLAEVSTFDAFEGLEISFSGFDQHGVAEVTKQKSDGVFSDIDYYIDDNRDLSLGDEVLVKLRVSGQTDQDAIIEKLSQEYGMVPEAFEKTFKVEGLDEYVAKYESMDLKFVDQMDKKIGDELDKQIEGNYTDNEINMGKELIGHFFASAKDGGSNMLYVIYKIHSWNDVDGEFFYYSYGLFRDIVTNSKGECTVDLDDYELPDGGSAFGLYGDAFRVNDDSNYYYIGFKTYDDLVDRCVKENEEDYDVQDLVENTKDEFTGTPSDAIPEGYIDLSGTWNGSYTANQGDTSLSLKIDSCKYDGTVTATFNFGPLSSNPDVPNGSYKMEGTIDFENNKIVLNGTEWIDQPDGYVFIDIDGTLDRDKMTINDDGNSLLITLEK